jgi:hypothetical protein
VSKWVLLGCGSVTVWLRDAIKASSLRSRVHYLFARLVKAHVLPLLFASETKVLPSLLLASMSYFPPYLWVAIISLLNLPALLFRWTRGVESRFSAWPRRWLLGRPLHWSMPVKAHATRNFPLQWCIFFRPTCHYVRDNYTVLSNIAHVYHIVVVRVIWTSWTHVWRLHFCFLGTGYGTTKGTKFKIRIQDPIKHN